METNVCAPVIQDFNDGCIVYSLSMHRQNLIQQFNLLRQEDFLTDIVLRVNDKLFPCHKLILVACSPYFKGMFRERNYSESMETIIDLVDVSPVAVDILLSYMYSGSLKISEQVVGDVIFAANMWLLQDIVQTCRSFLKSKLSVETCVSTLYWANLFNFTDVIHLSKQFLCGNFLKVALNEEFLKLSFKDLLGVILDPNLSAPKEDVLSAVISWIESNQEITDVSMISLMSLIPLNLVSLECLKQKSSCKLWQTLPQCAEYLKHVIDGKQSAAALDVKKISDCEIYILVGNDSGSPIFKFNIYSGQFQSLTNVPNKHCCCGSAFIGNKIFSIDTADSLAVSKYDPLLNYWQSCKQSPFSKRILSTVGVLDRNIYLCGGIGHNRQAIGAVVKYNSETDEWSTVASMQQNRFGACAAELNGYLYIIGGTNATGHLSSCERYSALFNKWEHICSLPSPRFGASVVVVNECLFVIGGSNQRKKESSVFKYNLVSQTWSSCTEMPYSASWLSACAVGNRIVVSGGWNNNKVLLNKTAIFDIGLNTWSLGVELPCPLAYHTSFLAGK